MRKLVSERLIEEVKKAVANGEKLPWQKPWKGGELVNMASKHKFVGGANIIMLMLAGEGRHRFATPAQIKKAGGTIKKGAKTIPLLFPLLVPEKDKAGNPLKTSEGKALLKCIGWRYYKVIADKYVEGGSFPVIEEEKETEIVFEPIEELESVIGQHEIDLKHEGGRACYSPLSDSIKMPAKESFVSVKAYYKTLLHEIAHWSAKRVNQDIKAEDIEGANGSKAQYGFEELRAEIACCMVLTSCGFDIEEETAADSLKNSVAYLQSWLKALQSNPDWLLTAALHADKRASFVLNPQGYAEKQSKAV